MARPKHLFQMQNPKFNNIYIELMLKGLISIETAFNNDIERPNFKHQFLNPLKSFNLIKSHNIKGIRGSKKSKSWVKYEVSLISLLKAYTLVLENEIQRNERYQFYRDMKAIVVIKDRDGNASISEVLKRIQNRLELIDKRKKKSKQSIKTKEKIIKLQSKYHQVIVKDKMHGIESFPDDYFYYSYEEELFIRFIFQNYLKLAQNKKNNFFDLFTDFLFHSQEAFMDAFLIDQNEHLAAFSDLADSILLLYYPEYAKEKKNEKYRSFLESSLKDFQKFWEVRLAAI